MSPPCSENREAPMFKTMLSDILINYFDTYFQLSVHFIFPVKCVGSQPVGLTWKVYLCLEHGGEVLCLRANGWIRLFFLQDLHFLVKLG